MLLNPPSLNEIQLYSSTFVYSSASKNTDSSVFYTEIEAKILNTEGPLYEGTSVNLECSVRVDRDVVDTEVLTAFTFTRTPDVVLSSSNVTGTGVTFTGVVVFALLVSSRDEGQISCESRFLPVGNPLYVQAVENDPGQYLLEIECKNQNIDTK